MDNSPEEILTFYLVLMHILKFCDDFDEQVIFSLIPFPVTRYEYFIKHSDLIFLETEWHCTSGLPVNDL